MSALAAVQNVRKEARPNGRSCELCDATAFYCGGSTVKCAQVRAGFKQAGAAMHLPVAVR